MLILILLATITLTIAGAIAACLAAVFKVRKWQKEMEEGNNGY